MHSISFVEMLNGPYNFEMNSQNFEYLITLFVKYFVKILVYYIIFLYEFGVIREIN